MFAPFEPEKGERRVRKLVFARGQVPVRVLIPNLFTLMGLCAGLTAIRMAIELRYEIAIAALVFAAVLDAIDGRVARLLKASSRFGAELDSLADFVNFGVAPGIIIFTWALGDSKSLGWIVVLVFALCAALRLARFNVALDNTDQPRWMSSYFVGVPAPAAAIIVLLPLYVENLGLAEVAWLTPIILVYTLAIALLMVSGVPTFSGKLIGQRIAREYVPPVLVLTALFVAVLVTYPYITLTVGSLLYIAVIPFSYLAYKRRERDSAKHAKAQNGRRAAPSDTETAKAAKTGEAGEGAQAER